MAAIQPTGTAYTEAVVFNSGHITIDGVKISDISNVNLTITSSAQKAMVLNKRVAAAIRRGNEEHQATFEVTKDFIDKIYQDYFGNSSVPAAGETQYSAIDGQPTRRTLYITQYVDDDASKTIQYQVQEAIITSISPTTGQEGYMTHSVTIDCTQIIPVRDNSIVA